MKQLAGLLVGVCLAAGVCMPVQAENAVKSDMKNMSKSYRAASKASDLATLKTELGNLREATLKAQNDVPADLQKQPADSPQRKTYSEGIAKLLVEIDAALAQANAGKLKEAQAGLDKIKNLQREYHKKLGV